ncbi:MAG TPA: hypothetical protein VJ508_03265, partial [Saprospiraceae bacterium]|nr:hypothetical protein [Saprospiraceae bacterium]
GVSIPHAVASSDSESRLKGRQIANSIAQLNPYAVIAVEGSKIVLPISEATDDSADNLNTPLNHDAATQPVMIASEIPEPIVAASGIPNLSASPTLPNLNSAIPLNLESSVPGPKFIKAINHTFTEFAVLTQWDYNGLRMPEDRLYSNGRQIIFPSKGIMSPGYGGGFTIALGHPLWALETGVIYSSKDFRPGRQLVIGGAFDNGSVEFKDMRLQIVSLPVQYRYRFDHKGRFKSYAMAGFGFNVIAQSDIDVITKYHFASLSFGEDPNNDPNLYPTIQETKRISEHIRDGAPFSTKSFVTANAGLGIEYAIYGHKSLFLQSAIQYQIPNIEFSNNNGKHLRSISVQAGVRGPLGK